MVVVGLIGCEDSNPMLVNGCGVDVDAVDECVGKVVSPAPQTVAGLVSLVLGMDHLSVFDDSNSNLEDVEGQVADGFEQLRVDGNVIVP